MVELIVLACLLSNPQHCEEFQIPFLQPMQVTQCVYQGQLRTMQWATQHPGWVIKRWSCGLPRA
jgi:acyl-ACP thioesterase